MKYKLKSNISKGFLLRCRFDATEWTEEMISLFQETLFSKEIYWDDQSKGEMLYAENLYFYTDNKYLSYGTDRDGFYDENNIKLAESTWDDLFEPVEQGVKLDESNFNKHVLSEPLSPEDLVGLKVPSKSTKEALEEVADNILPTTEWTDKHYDNYYTLTEDDIKEGKIRIDAYFVNRMWKLNSIDDTGAAFHSLKTYARLGNGKNSMERELNALNGQLKRWAKLMNVKLKY